MLLASCSSSSESAGDPNAVKVYVGTVDGTDMRVGLVTEHGAAALFFCGGASTLADTKWFRSTSADPKGFNLTKDDWAANGSATDALASGEVQIGARNALAWHASRVQDGSPAGLYDYRATDGTGGVVVASEDVAQGAFIGPAPGLKVSQIIVFHPVHPDGEALSVTVDSRPLVVSRVHPAPPQTQAQ